MAVRSLVDLRPAIVGDDGGGLARGRIADLPHLVRWLGDISRFARSVLAVGGGDEVRHGGVLAVRLPLDTRQTRPGAVALGLALDAFQTAQGGFVAFLLGLPWRVALLGDGVGAAVIVDGGIGTIGDV